MELFDNREPIKTTNDEVYDLPWIEKYRPKNFDEMISNNGMIDILRDFIKSKNLPHLLFYGPPGTGKTSAIMACSKELYKHNKPYMVLELNASDERGIEVVRNRIKQFALTGCSFLRKDDNSLPPFKLVILDEIDAMTDDAQSNLRQILEKYAHNVRFCLICNYIKKINPALISRSVGFRFAPLNKDQIMIKLKEIVGKENIKSTEKGLKLIVHRSNGDMRRVLNILQSTNMAYGKITEDSVNSCTGYPKQKKLDNLIQTMMTKNFETSYKQIYKLKQDYSMALSDLIFEIYELTCQSFYEKNIFSSWSEDKRMDFFINLRNLEYNQIGLSSDYIQLGAFVALFNINK
jgi:replication factor C subunit 3/5